MKCQALILSVMYLFIFMAPTSRVLGQDRFISGKVMSADKTPLAGATVTIRDSSTVRIIAFAITRGDGTFRIKDPGIQAGKYALVVEHISVKRQIRIISQWSENLFSDNNDFNMTPSARELKEVVVTAKPPAFIIRSDTIDFRAEAFRNAGTRKVEDLFRNIQGFQVTSDGRISFNGKEVDRILLEGEDLTEKNYKLLSRNLNAQLIDRIQVLNNYDKDRLLKRVRDSDKVGINLTIDAKYRNRITGSLEVGSGPGGREYIDNSLVRLGKKMKLMSFLNFNETGIPANANLDYHFSGDGSTDDAASEEQGDGILGTGDIYLPQIDKTYSDDNRDLSGYLIFSSKLGKGSSLKALGGAGKSELFKNAKGFEILHLPDSEKWEYNSKENFFSKKNDKTFKFTFNHDQGKKNTGEHAIGYFEKKGVDNYSNITSGIITDSLMERLEDNSPRWHLSGKEIYALSERGAITTVYNLMHKDASQHLFMETGRFQDLSQMYVGVEKPNQNLDRNASSQSLASIIHVRSLKFDWRYGLAFAREDAKMEAGTFNMEDDGSRTPITGLSESDFSSWRIPAFISFDRRGRGKSVFAGGLNIGPAGVAFQQGKTREQMTTILYKGVMGFRHSFSPLESMMIRYDIGTELPSSKYFFPVQLLSGQATILQPAFSIVSRRTQQFIVSYNVNDLTRGGLLNVHFSFRHTDGSYNHSSVQTPAYLVSYLLPMNGNVAFFSNVKTEKYLKKISIKISLDISGSHMGGDLYFNDRRSRNTSSNISFQSRFSSGGKGPFKVETGFTAYLISSKTVPEVGLSSQFRQWQHQAFSKLKFISGNRTFFAVSYGYKSLSSMSAFQHFDFYASHALKKSWTFMLTGHNLLNTTSIDRLAFDVNSSSEQSMSIVGRYLLLKVALTF